jgi:hypothetical protein
MAHLHIYGAATSLFLIVAHIDQATLYLLCLVSFLWLGRHKEADGWMLQEMTVLCCSYRSVEILVLSEIESNGLKLLFNLVQPFLAILPGRTAHISYYSF